MKWLSRPLRYNAAMMVEGMQCVVVTFGYTTVPPGELGADAVIDRFQELLPALDRLAARRAA